jgi:DNA-binding XRE family transcriptional regulator
MKPTRTLRTIRVSSNVGHSLVRVRTTRKSKSRRRPTPRKLAAKLAQIRERLELSQSEIASKLGVRDRASISGYERGEREPPLPVLLEYARLGKVPMETLVDDKLDLPDS